MPVTTDLQTARAILGTSLIGPEEIAAAYSASLSPELTDHVPFSRAELEAARDAGDILILRSPSAGSDPLTVLWLIRRYAAAFDSASLSKMGYQLKNDWGIELEPLAARDTCGAGWALVGRQVLPGSLNRNHEEQDEEIAKYAAERGAGGRTRRRTAIEAAYDTIAIHHATGERLLERSFDWTSSSTVDGGLLNLGRFDTRGMQILSFSLGIRHGQLGTCVNIDPE